MANACFAQWTPLGAFVAYIIFDTFSNWIESSIRKLIKLQALQMQKNFKEFKNFTCKNNVDNLLSPAFQSSLCISYIQSSFLSSLHMIVFARIFAKTKLYSSFESWSYFKLFWYIWWWFYVSFLLISFCLFIFYTSIWYNKIL